MSPFCGWLSAELESGKGGVFISKIDNARETYLVEVVGGIAKRTVKAPDMPIVHRRVLAAAVEARQASFARKPRHLVSDVEKGSI